MNNKLPLKSGANSLITMLLSRFKIQWRWKESKMILITKGVYSKKKTKKLGNPQESQQN